MEDLPATLELAHHHPGRLRLRSAALRGSPPTALGRSLCLSMESLPGVLRVAHHQNVGSLLVEYDPALVDGSTLLEVSIAQGFRLSEPPRHEPDAAARAVFALVGKTNHAIRELTGGRADLKTLVPLALGLAGVRALFINPVPARWDNLLYWSYATFLGLNSAKSTGEPP